MPIIDILDFNETINIYAIFADILSIIFSLSIIINQVFSHNHQWPLTIFYQVVAGYYGARLYMSVLIIFVHLVWAMQCLYITLFIKGVELQFQTITVLPLSFYASLIAIAATDNFVCGILFTFQIYSSAMSAFITLIRPYTLTGLKSNDNYLSIAIAFTIILTYCIIVHNVVIDTSAMIPLRWRREWSNDSNTIDSWRDQVIEAKQHRERLYAYASQRLEKVKIRKKKKKVEYPFWHARNISRKILISWNKVPPKLLSTINAIFKVNNGLFAYSLPLTIFVSALAIFVFAVQLAVALSEDHMVQTIDNTVQLYIKLTIQIDYETNHGKDPNATKQNAMDIRHGFTKIEPHTHTLFYISIGIALTLGLESLFVTARKQSKAIKNAYQSKTRPNIISVYRFEDIVRFSIMHIGTQIGHSIVGMLIHTFVIFYVLTFHTCLIGVTTSDTNYKWMIKIVRQIISFCVPFIIGMGMSQILVLAAKHYFLQKCNGSTVLSIHHRTLYYTIATLVIFLNVPIGFIECLFRLFYATIKTFITLTRVDRSLQSYGGEHKDDAFVNYCAFIHMHTTQYHPLMLAFIYCLYDDSCLDFHLTPSVKLPPRRCFKLELSPTYVRAHNRWLLLITLMRNKSLRAHRKFRDADDIIQPTQESTSTQNDLMNYAHTGLRHTSQMPTTRDIMTMIADVIRKRDSEIEHTFLGHNLTVPSVIEQLQLETEPTTFTNSITETQSEVNL